MINAVKDEIIDYTSFVSFIKDRITDRMGRGYDIKLIKVIKNNALELDGLVVLKEGEKSAPNIYLNAYYDAYLAGTPMKEIVERICTLYKQSVLPVIKPDFRYTLELMKPYIFFRLVNSERNKKLLTRVPHIEYLDLALTFHCLVQGDDDGIGAIRITNEHIGQWGITLDELFQLAKENTRVLFPPIIRPIEEVIRELQGDNEIIDFGAIEGEIYPMYILTNQKGINGASCIIYKDVIKDFAKQHNSNVIILPSSIHEIILVPTKDFADKEWLKSMVIDINSTQVPIEEVLSDNVYQYLLEKDEVIL